MIRFKPHLILFPLLVCGLALTGSSAAQTKPAGTASSDSEALAGELFDKGNVFYKQSRWADAEVQFQKAWDVRRGFDIAANLGDCELQTGQLREAAEHLAYAIREFPLSGKAALRERLQKRFAEAREQVGVLRAKVDVAGAVITVDGREVGRSPLSNEVFVDPGSHSVEAQLAGYELARKTIEVPKGAAGDVVLSLVKKSAPPPPPPPPSASSSIGTINPPPAPGGPSKPIVIAGGAGAGAALVAGVVFAVLANGKASSAREATQALVGTGGTSACAQPSEACQQIAGTLESWTTFKNAAVGSFIGAGALGAATVVYALVAKNPPPTAVRATPVVTATGGALMISGTW
jgi:hypothetical protein